MKSHLLRYTAIILLLAINIKGGAQSISTSNVSGMVVDSLYKPIEYAAVQLFSTQDSTISYGAATAEDGTYLMKNVVQGKYRLKVSSIGFEVKTKPVDLSQAKQNTSLGLIILEASAVQLDGAEVKATRTGISEKIDRIVFVPDSASLKAAKTGVDILNRIPEVRVDKRDNTISVLGNKNVLVLVNGVDNSRSIISIHPSDIERIELVTHPSVRYQSDVASVVNIVLKGYRQKGFTLNSNLYYSIGEKNHSGSIQLDYGVGKWHFFASYMGNYKKTTSIDSISREDIEEGLIDKYFSYSTPNNIADAAFNRFQYGFDYNINKNNLLSFTSRIATSGLESFRNNTVYSLLDNQKVYQSKIGSEFNSDRVDQNYSLYYLHNFKREKEKLEVNMNYFVLNNSSHHIINDSTTLYSTFDSYSSIREINDKSNQHSLNTKVDYYKPISNTISAEFGYQFYGRKIKNETATLGNEYSDVSYMDYRNSLYASASFSKKKWGIQAGLRVEKFNVEVSDVKNNRTKLLPYAAIFHEFNPNNSLKLTYRKSLNYPIYSSLNPFKYYASDSLSYFTGNPYLKPMQNNNLSLKYSYKKKSSYLSVSLDYDYLDDLIAQEILVENNVLAYRYNNVGKANRYGVTFSLSTTLFNWVEVEMLLKGGYTDYYAKKTHDGYSYAAECGVYVPLFWDIDLEVYGVFKEREINYNGYNEYGGYIEEILLTKNIAKNLYLGFALWQPFIRSKDTDKTWGNTFTETNRYRELRTPYYLVNLTYHFKSGKNIKKIKTDSYMEDIQNKGKQAR